MKQPASAAALRRPDAAGPWVLGHRGARHAAPENTMRAFQLALDEGACGVELDVRLDGAGRVIVLHDVDLARVTEGEDRRCAHELLPAELARIRVGRSEPVPLLSEVLDWSRERGARVNVELKRDVPSLSALSSAVSACIKATRASPDLVFFSSFHPWLVRASAASLPEYCSCWLIHHKQRAFQAGSLYWSLGAAGVHPEHLLVTAERMSRWRRAGALVNTWTVNDPEQARRLSELGVDAIISDNPGLILRSLDAAP